MNLLAPIYSVIHGLSQRLSEARAGNLEQINSTRMPKIDTLESRLSEARAGNLEQINSTRMPKIDTLESRLSEARAGNLDLIDDIDADVTALLSRWSATRAAYLDEVRGDVNAVLTGTHEIQGDVNALVARLTAARAGYLDRLVNGGISGTVKSIQSGTAAFYGNNSYVDITISSIVYSKTVVLYSLSAASSPHPVELYLVSHQFLNQTKLRLNRCNQYSVSAGATVSWQVIEYY